MYYTFDLLIVLIIVLLPYEGETLCGWNGQDRAERKAHLEEEVETARSQTGRFF